MATAKAETLPADEGPPVLPPPEPPPVVEARATTPPQFGTGSVLQDPSSQAVAVRTDIPDPDSNHDWGVMTVDRGGHYAGWDEVAAWTVLVTAT